jgi:hypothetical protein
MGFSKFIKTTKIEIIDNLFEKLNLNEKIEEEKVFTFTITNFNFDGLSYKSCIEIYKDGRPFSYFIEPWLVLKFPFLKHIKGCKPHDHVNVYNEDITYDQKTFTKLGCKFMPSNMIGQGRTFNEEVFNEKASKLIYIIVSNVYFPQIKVKFIKGIDLIKTYQNGIIKFKDHDNFFKV